MIGKAIVSSFVVVVLLASCNSATPTPEIKIAVVESQTGIPSVTSAPLTETPVPVVQDSPVPVSGTPTIVVLENGLTWTECVIPYQDYFHNKSDIQLITTCLGMHLPSWDENDRMKYGERPRGINGQNLRLIVADNIYETSYTQSNPYDYKLTKNGIVIARASAHFVTFDPNRNLGNLGGKVVWEVITDPPVLIIDGVNINEEYHLEGSFFPYEINGKLIYLAKKNGKYHLVYEEKAVGPEFDEISMAYCCAKLSVSYGKGQYWFLGRRNGVQFIVAIH